MFDKAFSKFALMLFGTILAVTLSVTFDSAVRATPVFQDISWAKSLPYVYSTSPISDISLNGCSMPNQSFEVEGELGPRQVCIDSDGPVKFGSYFDVWFRQIPLIGFQNDSKMYKLHLSCDRPDSCIYVPKHDLLITKEYRVSNTNRSLVVYKNFSERLRPMINGIWKAYGFDYTDPDYIFQSEAGYQWPVNGMATSKDGDWLAVEYKKRGIGILDLGNLQMKQISQLKLSYGRGFDSHPEMAVSDGGQHVALMGLNSPTVVFDVTPDCGEVATDQVIRAESESDFNCPMADLNIAPKFIDYFTFGVRPRFDSSGGELNFYAYSYYGDEREVTLRANGYGGQRIDYLALGDSFSSGEGETDDKYYLPGTNDKYEKCHVSERAYSFILAGLQGIEPDFVRSVACSGATMEDVVGSDTGYFGQWKRLGSGGANMVLGDITLAQTIARMDFVPGRIHQESFVGYYKPTVLTIGIGGNDANLVGKLGSCAGLDTCDWAKDAERREQTAIEIKSLFPKLVETYIKLHNDSPNSKIYAVGYPQSVEPFGDCDFAVDKLINSDERQYLSESIIYLNQVIEAATRLAGIGYIDIEDALGNQVLCGSQSPSAMNGIRTGDDKNYGWVINIGNESFHPNPLGNELIADKIDKVVGNLLTNEYCSDGLSYCPDSDSSVPEPSLYWLPDGYHDYRKLIAKQFLSDGAEESQKKIVLDNYSFAPNSEVEVQITSEPQSLGNYSAGSSGSFEATINLPDNLEYGFHTIHLYGTSYAGEPIEIYQIVEHRRKPAEPPVSIETLTPLAPVDPLETIAPTISTTATIGLPVSVSNPIIATASASADRPVIDSVASDSTAGNNSMPQVEGLSTVRTTGSTSETPSNSDQVDYRWIAGMAVLVLVIIALAIVWARKSRSS